MSKRNRKRKPGRRVYYKPWSHAQAAKALPRNVMVKEAAQRARFVSEANLAARAVRESHWENAIIKTFGMNRGADNKPREQALNQLAKFVRLDEMDRHMVVHKGLKTVRILFYNKDETKWWFVERNLHTGGLSRSIEYGSREQAFIYHDLDRVRFVSS